MNFLDSKEYTALTGLFRNNPAFATATYGTVTQPLAPVHQGCSYRIALGNSTWNGTDTLSTFAPQLSITSMGAPLPSVISIQDLLHKWSGLPVPIHIDYQRGNRVDSVSGDLRAYKKHQYHIQLDKSLESGSFSQTVLYLCRGVPTPHAGF